MLFGGGVETDHILLAYLETNWNFPLFFFYLFISHVTRTLQDSGFSDAENSPTLSSNKKNISSNVSSSEDETPGNSPSTSRSIQTPPTVVRRPAKQPIYEEIDAVKRLSFSAPSSPIVLDCAQFDSSLKFDRDEQDTSRTAANRSFKIKRSKVITRGSSRRSLNKSTTSTSSSSDGDKSYHNETVYFGAVPTTSSPMLECSRSEMEEKSLLNASSLSFAPSHSTPKRPSSLSLSSSTEILENIANLLPRHSIYRNTLLNGHLASVQSWIDGLQCDVSSEVMSTLQTKSIERIGQPKLTPVLAYKMIKSLQTKVATLESDFRRVERASSSMKVHEADLMEAIHSLTDAMMDFIANQEPKRQLYCQSAKNYKQLAENFASIREMTTDLKRLVVKIDIDDLDEYPILNDLQLIKRYLLITIRLIFNLLISVIVDNIEHTHNELVLGSNIMHLVLLLTNEFAQCDGFPSLNDALTGNSIVRVLLLICFENKSEWIRSLSLRTLSLVCKNEETLQQFGLNSGFEILRDMLIEPNRSELEIKETISCLASLTGPWQQRTSESNFGDLRDYSEDFIERITNIVEMFGHKHAQMLLICIAVLNNLSRLDPASAVYSLIAHQSIARISKAYEPHGNCQYTIFLLEQISGLLLNMSSNRKSHYHLTSRPNLNFILDVFNTAYDARIGDDETARGKAQQSVLRNVMRAMKQLEAQSSNHELDAILTKIRCRLSAMNNLSESFNISCNAKNVTKISIYSQETFFWRKHAECATHNTELSLRVDRLVVYDNLNVKFACKYARVKS